MKLKFFTWVLVVILLAAILLAACSTPPTGGTPTTPAITATVPQVLPATAAPTATLTPTPIPPTPTTAPTETPQATSPTPSTLHTLTMASGQTETSATGHLDANQQAGFHFTAQAGQYLELAINTTDPTMILEVTTPDNQPLVKAADQVQSWQGTLPANGQYQVTILSKDTPGDYSLAITIPVRVQFAPGTTSLTLQGTVAGQQVTTYMVKAQKDQTLSVSINSKGNDIFLSIYGLEDGQPYLRSMMGSTSASIQLPLSQDYMVQCVSNNAGEEAFEITISVK